MRTTRGPGFTTIEQTYLITVDDTTVRTGFSDALNVKDAWPADLRAVDADKVEFDTGFWWDNHRNKNNAVLRVHFEDLGHAKRAEAAMKRLKAIRLRGLDSAYVQDVVRKSLEDEAKRVEAAEAAKNLAWVASGIVYEGRRKAREEMQYDDKLKRLRTELANRTENHSIDMAVVVAGEHGFNEAELKAAVEAALNQPAHFIGSY
jgi:pyridoxine 5'-phosphate synthase PdxJ